MRENPARFRVIGDAALPFRDDTFGTVCSEHFFEHLPKPLEVFLEATRVLRNEGHFVFAAPHAGEPCYTVGLPILRLVAAMWHKLLEVSGPWVALWALRSLGRL